MGIFRSISRQVSRLLFITLGTMWLSFAIAPCVLIPALEKNQHNCCPESRGKDGTSTHMHSQGQCDSCAMVQPVLKSPENYTLSSVTPGSNHQPGIIEWNYKQTRQPVNISHQISPGDYQTLPPPLRFRVLLI